MGAAGDSILVIEVPLRLEDFVEVENVAAVFDDSAGDIAGGACLENRVLAPLQIAGDSVGDDVHAGVYIALIGKKIKRYRVLGADENQAAVQRSAGREPLGLRE